MKIKIWIVGFIVIFIGIYLYNKNVERKADEATIKEIIGEHKKFNKDEGIETYSYLNDNQVALAAQKFVEKSLKAPSTAKFPALFKSSVKKNSSGSYSVSSYVDSQNGFGAMIRSNFVVELKQKHDGKIILIDMKINP